MSDLPPPPSLPAVADVAVGSLLAMHEHSPVVVTLENAFRNPIGSYNHRGFYAPVRVAIVILEGPSAEHCWEDLTNLVVSAPNLSLAVNQAQQISQTAGYLADLVSKPEAADEIRIRLMEAAISKHAS